LVNFDALKQKQQDDKVIVMADDILLTREEQDERAKQWLKDNAISLIVGIAIGVGIIYGINHYRAQQQINAELASDLYQNVITATATSEQADIDQYINDLKSQHADSSYASKAVLIKAKQLTVIDLPAATAELEWVLEHAEEVGVQHTARLRLIKLLLAQDKFDSASQLANFQNTDGFDSHYHEAVADVAMGQQNFSQAKEYYQKAIDALAENDQAYKSILTLKLNQITQ